jgi:hypothetical protein
MDRKEAYERLLKEGFTAQQLENLPDTGSATAGRPSALTAMAMRMPRMVSATRPSSRSVSASKGMSVKIGATMSG